MVSRFEIVALADPHTLIRLLNYFAQRGLVPNRIIATEAEGFVNVQIEQAGLTEPQARIIAERMRGSVLVDTVEAVVNDCRSLL